MKRILYTLLLLALCACQQNPGKPLIGISCGRTASGNATLSKTYTPAITAAGGIPVVMPTIETEAEADALIGRMDGFVFSGGPDVDPAEYGETIWNETVDIDAVRDRSDLLLARAALRSKKPVLAICRGSQLFNIVLGGSLYQDIPTQVEDAIPHADTLHVIRIEKNSILHRVFGKDSLTVNSTHHQAVKKPAPGIRITARTSDSVVEAYETDQVTAVQFHPEKLLQTDTSWTALFRHFIERCQ